MTMHSDKRLPRVKYDGTAKLTLMASAKGYVMARRSGCYPVIRTEQEWRALSDTPDVPAAMMGETDRC